MVQRISPFVHVYNHTCTRYSAVVNCILSAYTVEYLYKVVMYIPSVRTGMLTHWSSINILVC